MSDQTSEEIVKEVAATYQGVVEVLEVWRHRDESWSAKVKTHNGIEYIAVQGRHLPVYLH